MKNKSIYQKAVQNGCFLEATCVGIGVDKWDELMKGAREANKLKVIRVALEAGVIDIEQAKNERKFKSYNPYQHFVTRTHVVYVNSGIEHFIKIN